MVLPDHPTPIPLRTHTADPVPFAIHGHGADSVSAFDERSVVKESYGVRIGSDLVRRMYPTWVKSVFGFNYPHHLSVSRAHLRYGRNSISPSGTGMVSLWFRVTASPQSRSNLRMASRSPSTSRFFVSASETSEHTLISALFS